MSNYQTVLSSCDFASVLVLVYGIYYLRTGITHKRKQGVIASIRNNLPNAFFDNLSNESEIFKLFEAIKSSQ